MININIPGYRDLLLEILILDYNGTLALDGLLSVSLKDRITRLAEDMEIHIITSDTFGSVAEQCHDLPVTIKVLSTDNHTQEKADYLKQFGTRMKAAVGNGTNDQLMLTNAELGILVLGTEGCSKASLLAADVIVKDGKDALDLLVNPMRLIATLRS